MQTEYIQANENNLTGVAQKAGCVLQNGGIVAIPTETVYGLAANALNGEAVKKIFAAKGRPQDNPLIVHITEFSEVHGLVSEVPDSAKALAEKYWPGPLTIIMPKSEKIPDEVSAGLDTVAIRMPAHPVARAIIKAAGVPLAAPSANISGRPSPTRAKYVYEDMNGKIDMIIDGGQSAVGVESTVITLAVNPPRLLRPGGITVEQLRAVLGAVEVDDAVMHKLKEEAKAASPGMKYKHYAPKAEITVIKGGLDAFRQYVARRPESFALCFEGEEAFFENAVTYGRADDANSQANRLFDALRELDEKGAKIVFARDPGTSGVDLAVYNRLIRAAAFRVVTL